MLTTLFSAEKNVGGERTVKLGIIQSSTAVILNLKLSIKQVNLDGCLEPKIVFKMKFEIKITTSDQRYIYVIYMYKHVCKDGE